MPLQILCAPDRPLTASRSLRDGTVLDRVCTRANTITSPEPCHDPFLGAFGLAPGRGISHVCLLLPLVCRPTSQAPGNMFTAQILT